jgi:biopolymer transport protein ExbD
MMPMGSGLSTPEEPELLMDINTTPLIDVLLVLLVMLIITIPIQLHAVNAQLPVAAGAVVAPTREPIEIAIDAADRMTWQGELVSREELGTRMADLAQRADPPDIRVRPDRRCSYAQFAHVLAESRRRGLSRLSVIGSEQFR